MNIRRTYDLLTKVGECMSEVKHELLNIIRRKKW